MIGQLIAGNFPTRVYYAVQGGFDTHANQSGTQAKLLGDLGDSMHAFLQDLRAQKNSDRVTVLAFSEFGASRRTPAAGPITAPPRRYSCSATASREACTAIPPTCKTSTTAI